MTTALAGLCAGVVGACGSVAPASLERASLPVQPPGVVPSAGVPVSGHLVSSDEGFSGQHKIEAISSPDSDKKSDWFALGAQFVGTLGAAAATALTLKECLENRQQP